MENISNCPLCQSHDLSSFLQVKDHMVSGEDFELMQCGHCSFIFTSPRPDFTDIGRYYESEAYISHSGTSKGLVNKLYHIAQTFTLRRKYRLVKGLSGGRSLLDYGCGAGLFLQYCQQRQMHVAGVEPSKNAREICQEKHGLSVWHPDQVGHIPGTFDVITMWHVLEHIHDLDTLVAQVLPLLNSNGKLIVALPNAQSADAQKYKSFWAAWDVPRHLYHFTPATIERFFAKCHFHVSASIPMHLDAFYVSLLSEKYLGSRFKLLRGLCSGIRTFIRANQINKQYSSIIYVLTRIPLDK